MQEQQPQNYNPSVTTISDEDQHLHNPTGTTISDNEEEGHVPEGESGSEPEVEGGHVPEGVGHHIVTHEIFVFLGQDTQNNAQEITESLETIASKVSNQLITDMEKVCSNTD